MDGLWWKTLLKLMIWGYHYFWKHPNLDGCWSVYFIPWFLLIFYWVMTSSNKRFIGIPYWKCFTILGMTGILGWGLIYKVYFIPCFAIRFQGIWCTFSVLLCVFLKAMSDELLSGRDTWNQLPGETHLVLLLRCCLGVVSGWLYLRFTMVNHHVSPPIGECFFTFSKHPGHANLSSCTLFQWFHLDYYTEKCCVFLGGFWGWFFWLVLYKSWICLFRVMFDPIYQGWFLTTCSNHPEKIWRLRVDQCPTGWWQLKYFLIFTPIWGRFPFWLIFFKGVENTN